MLKMGDFIGGRVSVVYIITLYMLSYYWATTVGKYYHFITFFHSYLPLRILTFILNSLLQFSSVITFSFQLFTVIRTLNIRSRLFKASIRGLNILLESLSNPWLNLRKMYFI